MTPIPLFKMFPFLKESAQVAADYGGAQVVSVTVNTGKTKMDIALSTQSPVPPFEIAKLEGRIASEYGIEAVNIEVVHKLQTQAPAKPASAANGNGNGKPARPVNGAPTKKRGGPALAAPGAILGRVIKAAPKPIGDVKIDDGKAVIRGYVCAVRSRFLDKSNAWMFVFDITDYTGTITVSKFMQDEKAKDVVEAVKEGAYLTVAGPLKINNRDGELNLDPHNVFVSEAKEKTDDAEQKRVELHLHTKMSATDGLTDVKEVVYRAAKWGHNAIAITDHGVVHAFPDAAAAAGDAAKDGKKIKIIYGMEGYFREGAPPTDPPKKERNYHIIILAKNKKGLKNLYELVTKSHTKHFHKKPIVYRSVLKKRREGLIIGSACESGELFCAVTDGKGDDELREIAEFYDYLEIQPLCNNMFMLRGDKPTAKNEDELRTFNKKIVELGKSLDIPVVATCDAHFLDPEHEIFRKIIMTGKGFESANDELPLYFRTTNEMLEEFSYLGEETAFEVVVTNTNKIAEMCEDISPLPPKDKFFPPRLENSAGDLENLVLESVGRLYGDNPPQIVTDRVDKELQGILRKGYDVIYMAAQKLVAYLSSIGSRVGSRGSVGSSFVAYLAGITEVNPLPAHYRCPNCNCKSIEFHAQWACGADMPDKTCPSCGTAYVKDGFNIPFETFLGTGGEKIPDIDLNISSWHYKSAHSFVYDMFGSTHVYRAGTISKIEERNAYGFVRGYLDMLGKSVSKAEENRLVKGCCGVKQTTGQHPGGLVIVPQDMEVTDFCPVQHPSDDSGKGVITTHFDYHKMEDNLIKLDMLGHDNPTMLLMLEEMTGIDADGIRLDDPDTMSIFSSPARLGLPEDDDIIGMTGVIGIPEFGTPFVRQMLCDTEPGNFDTLIRLSGYSHGEKVWLGNAKELIATGEATVAETISSRDDIMLYLISMGMETSAAFKTSESVRKGRGLPKGTRGKLRELDVPEWYMDSCDKIGYLFPKAHAVAYVIMAFRIAWFKVHRPLEYYSAHFYRRSQNGAFDAYTMTRGIDTVKSEIRRLKTLADTTKDLTKKDEELLVTLESCYEFYMRGFDFVPIDLYLSDAERFLTVHVQEQNSLRAPFIAISGLGSAAAQSLAEYREGRKFVSMEEVAACPGVNKTHVAELARIGALGELPETSQMSLF